MRYGYFDDKKREYIITNPKTPVTWINYIGNLQFGGFVNQTGGMLICKGDPALNRITKYIPQLPASDFKGSTLYLRWPEGAGYRLFSPFFVPTLDPYDRYECHVGLGYTCIVSEFYGIQTEVMMFVPMETTCVIWDVKVTNLTKRPLQLDAIPVIEYSHPDALKQFTNADWVPQTMMSELVTTSNGRTALLQYPFMNKKKQVNYLTVNTPVTSFESDRQKFLGNNGFGTWAKPLSLQQPELSNTEALRGDNIGALMCRLYTLEPGQTKRFMAQLGQVSEFISAQHKIDKCNYAPNVDKELANLATIWNSYLQKFQVNTPDVNLNQMLNIHNPRQCYITKNWSRYLSLYQLGLGARGIGFRDSSQDVIGILANMAEEGQALIRQLLHVQKRDGSAMHQFNPMTMIANEGDSQEDEEAPHYYSDNHLWIILAVAAYLKETGDLDFLREVIPFYDKDKHNQTLEAGTIAEHLERALAFTRRNVGQHGIPLAGFADWNDTVNLSQGAESLFTANLYGRALLEMIALKQHLGEETAVAQYQHWYDEMKSTVNQTAWDGNWYVRYFDHDGTPIGSHQNEQGQIFSNAQSWAVLSGFAPPERAKSALESVYQHLNTTKGIKLSTPGYNGFDPAKGGVTTYAPGAKENGGIFLHANPWVIIAETMTGNGSQAYDYYQQINPVAKNDQIETYECEPYVYAQNVLGNEHPQFGLARNSWLTGTASWMYQAGTQYILGIRPTYNGLMIDPCIPETWDGFTAVRQFRGVRYLIDVKNPDHVSRGVAKIMVNDVLVNGNVIGATAVPGTTIKIQIQMGG